jgi:tetratricopeptide (TPR) repeat protein
MAEKPTSPTAPTTPEARTPGPELRLLDRRAFVGFPSLVLQPGVVLVDFALQIPDVTFPLNVTGGAAKYQKRKLDFGLLELTIDAEVIHRHVKSLASRLRELDDVKLYFRPGALEVAARLRGPERAPVTFKVAFDGDGEKLAVYFYDVRFYAYASVPAARVPAMLADAVRELGVLPDVERRGASGFSTRILPALVERAAVARGYKMPSLDQARLAEATLSSKGLKLRFSSGGLPPPGTPDEDLLLTLEGTRAFADAEELLAQGRLREAREAYLRLGDATEAHPFAVERLLTLLVADPQAHDLALDVAASLGRRRERSATALWAEFVVRERRGEFARAAERALALCALARRQQEEAGAFFAAEAAARAARDHAPQMAVKALHELLGLKPDHLPSLKALARASDQAKDRAGAIRAYRRLAALARDPADAAEAHVQLARLCAQMEDDLAGARLHCEAALRLTPDHPEALLQLGELCFRSGEHLRAVKALDRLREVAMGRHDVDRVGRANLLAGQVWELGLKQPENALLRYREAASLLPGEPEPLALAARVAESLGKVQEAVAGYQQAIELAGPAPRNEAIRTAAHRAHHALARLLKTRLGEPARAREHLEAALALDPTDTVALDELLPYFRAAGRAAELADACEKAAAVIDEPFRRAALWAEAGELYRGRLNQPERAERLLGQALEADPRNRQALEALLALAESRRDGAQLCRCLKALLELSEEPKERVRHARRLIVAARDLAFDLDLAVFASREVLRLEPDDLPVLGELTALERRRSDMAGLAWALEQRARASEAQGDKRLAAAALRELGQVLDVRLGRSGEALVAYEKAARLAPEPTALLELATLSLRLERPANARRALEDALALLPRHAPPEKLAEVRARLGRACELLGDKESAREQYAQAFPLRRLDDELAGRLEALYGDAGLDRELTDLWASRAQALLQAGRAGDAAPLFFKAAQKSLEVGDRSGAMLRLTAALDAAPQGERAAQVLEAMASLELERGEPMEAARLSARRAQLCADGRETARWLFKAASLTRDTAREAPYLAQALEADGTFAPARLRRADLSYERSPREALADLEVVLATDPKDVDLASLDVDPVSLTRRTAWAALGCGQFDTARRLLAKYAAQRPEDLDAQLELARLHRRAGALEPLVDLLGELWPRMDGAARVAARREYTEGALQLGRTEAAIEALRGLLLDLPEEAWAAEKLLGLLAADEAHRAERLDLVSRLVTRATGEARAELLARRAELFRLGGELHLARTDVQEAATLSARPVPLLRTLAELARQAFDEPAELLAWRQVLDKATDDALLRRDGAERVLSLAHARARAGDLPRATDAYALAVTLPLDSTERFEAFHGLAQVTLAQGDARRAEAALLEASKQGPLERRVEVLLERAKLLESRQARAEAAQAYQAALALSPRHPLATAGLITSLRALGDWAALAEVLAAEAAQTPRERAAPLYAELAGLYLERLHEPGPGEAALRRVIALDEADVSARRRLGALLVEQGRLVEALALLEATAAHLPAPDAAAMLLQAAGLAFQSGDAEAELKLRRRAHALLPATGDDLRRLAEALYLQGAVREALPLQVELAAQVAFDEAPDEAESTLMRLADLASQTGDAGLAERTLRRVVQERPLHTQAVERLAELVTPRDARQGFELLARHAEGLSRSPRTAERLLSLARDARRLLDDAALSRRLYIKAAEGSDAPLAVRLELAAMLREAGQPSELLPELAELAQLHLTEGDIDAALGAWDEEARLAEGLGRLDDALRTLTAMVEVCADEQRVTEASTFTVRKAELLRDSKLDLQGAAQAFEQAWDFEERPAIAQAAMELARRRSDRDGEIDWLERTFRSLPPGLPKARGFFELARLHLGLSAQGEGDVASSAMLAPDQAEAALQASLREAFTPEAEAFLLGLYERQDRVLDLAQYYEAAAVRATDGAQRSALLLQAAKLYQERAGRPQDAAAALLAARAASPDDLGLTAQVADALHELGRAQEAGDFDALLLEHDAFHPAFERHRLFLTEAGDDQALAALLSRRAEKLSGVAAAQVWLEAAQAFRRAGADERAQLCEAQAFEVAPEHLASFETLLARAEGDARRQADLFLARARAVPAETVALLQRRAEVLTAAHEALLAAGAWDDYLAQAPDDARALEVRADLAFDAGGARAAQPYDRRLVQRFGEALSPEAQVKVQLRLGQAALEANAWHDATEALETVYTLAPQGPRAGEALSLLTEAYARLRDAQGQYRTTLRLARRAQGPDAEALFRQAVAVAESPVAAVEALEALLVQHVGEVALYEKGVEAWTASGRLGDLVSLHERHAAVTGGPRAAQALLAAAALCETELREPQRAFELHQAAVAAEPGNLRAVLAVLAELRRRGDTRAVVVQLRRLIERGAEPSQVNEWRLELAQLLEASGQWADVRRVVEPIRAQGPSADGYAQVLAQLERGARAENDLAALGEVLLARAQLVDAAVRAGLLLEAAQAFRAAGTPGRAFEVTREAVRTHTSNEGLSLLVSLGRDVGQHEASARALLELADRAEGDTRALHLLEALDAFEAARDPSGALGTLERLLRESPDAMGPTDLGERFTTLGEPARALQVAFGPALEAGRFAEARALARAVGDEAKGVEVLWAQARRLPTEAVVSELSAGLDLAGRRALAQVLEEGSAPALALPQWRALALEQGDAAALDALSRRQLLGAFVVEAAAAHAVPALLALTEREASLDDASREALFRSVAQWVPARRPAMLVALAGLEQRQGRVLDAVATLAELAQLEEAPLARAALHVERGQLLWRQANEPRLARVAFERALVDDGTQLAAVRALVELTREEPERFAAFVERLEQLAGPEAVVGERAALADAYETLGRSRDAYRLLGELEETPARLRRRAALAELLGLGGEALALREKVADTPAEREEILKGYLAAELVPFAVRLGRELLDAGTLEPATVRLLAERLATSAQGAELSVRAWPRLLSERLTDVDGWTLFGEALHRLGQVTQAAQVDGVGAVLTSSSGPAPQVPFRPVARARVSDELSLQGLLPVNDETMPRLALTVAHALEGFGAAQVSVWLDPEGGVEALMAGPERLVLGAGALAVFGPSELTWLVAFALALGETGQRLHAGEAVDASPAAVAAFNAFPSTLAAGRVLAQYDEALRGGDPHRIDVGEALRRSPAFAAICRRLLELLAS